MRDRKHIVKEQKLRPLWRCPRCGAKLVTENMWHSCGKYTVRALFARSEPHVYRLFRRFAAMVRECGRVTMVPQKTRVVFMVRVRFAGVYPRKTFVLISFALPRRLKEPEDQEDRRVCAALHRSYDGDSLRGRA